MQSFSGFMLIAAGMALAAFSALPQPRDGQAELAEVTRISAAPDRDVRLPKFPVAPRTFPAAVPSQQQPANGDAKVKAAAVNPHSVWTTVVTADPGDDTRPSHLRSSNPSDPETRATLASDLQRNLQRVGCYTGEINGLWTPSTKRAMSAFMDRVNATLPINEPDYILLTLVQGHTGAACGAACPTGQVMADGDRCVPRAVLAQSNRAVQRQQRMAQKEVVPAAPKRLAITIEPAEREVALQGAREDLPWLKPQDDRRLPQPTREPLPGRMAMGGPIDAADTVTGDTTRGTSAALVPPVALEGDRDTTRTDVPRDFDLAAIEESTAEFPPSVIVSKIDKLRRASPGVKRPKAVARPGRNYASNSGRGRRGDPRPGTMRYNLMQSLGGIY